MIVYWASKHGKQYSFYINQIDAFGALAGLLEKKK